MFQNRFNKSTKWFDIGKELGLSGTELISFVKEREDKERDERQASREDRKKEEEMLDKEEKILQMKLELARVQGQSRSDSSNENGRSLVPTPKLPHFVEGKDNMDAYLKRFEKYAEVQSWPKTSWAVSLSALLQGKALDVYCRLPADKAENYDALKEALLLRFELTGDDFRKKFRYSNPEPGETPSQFVVRLEHYLSRWIELSGVKRTFEDVVDMLLRQQLVERGGTPLALFLKERKPKNISEMTSLADTYVEAHGGHFGITKSNKSDRKGKPQGNKAPQSGSNEGKKSPGNPRNDLPPERRRIGPCYICNKMGHLAAKCNMRLPAASLVSDSDQSGSNIQHQNETNSVAPEVNSGSESCATCSQKRQGNSSETGGLLLTSSVSKGVEAELVPRDRVQEIPLMCAACQRRWRNQLPVVDGEIGSQKVTVLRDTGCSGVVVKKSLVKSDQFTGNYRQCLLIDGTVRQFPTAKVHISSPLFVGMTEALCMETPVFDVIIGNIEGVYSESNPHPDWKEVVEIDNNLQGEVGTVSSDRESDSHEEGVVVDGNDGTNIGMAVQTRSQSREARRPQRPLKVPSQIPDVSPEEIRQETAKDPTLKKARDLAEASLSDDRKDTYFLVEDGLLYRMFQPKGEKGNSVKQLVVPKAFRKVVMSLAHEGIMGGHQGIGKTTEKILTCFFWPGIHADVTRFCRSCDICQRTVPKGRVPKVPLGQMPVIDIPFIRVAIDIVGPIHPMTAKKNRYILTIVDYASRYPEAVALPNIETTTVAEAMVEVFCRVGVPHEILTDRGSQFTSDMMREVSRLLSIRQLTTTPYHPSCNGLVERFNQTLKQILKRVCADRPNDWDRYLGPVLFAYRSAPQASLKYSPFELIYGRQVRGPLEILKDLWSAEPHDPELKITYQYVVDLKERLKSTLEAAHDELRKATSRSERHYNARSRQRKFDPGDKVLILLPTDHNKLLLQWKGPFKVVHKLGDNDYRLDVGGKHKTFHANLLKRYIDRVNKSKSDSEISDTGSDVTANGLLEVIAQATIVDHEEEDDDDGNPSSTSNPMTIQVPRLEAKETVDDVKLGPDLVDSQQHQLKRLLGSYRDVMTDLPGQTHLGEHSIRLTSDDPVRQKPYPVPHALRGVIDEEVEKMIEMGVIEKSNSPYSSPIVIVKKSDGSNRFCIDFRRLNRVTIFDAEPLPNTEEIFSSLSGSHFFSKLDLSKGYWQIPLSEETKEKTAFQTTSGLYHFRVMPFGLVNAPATFSRVMRKLLTGMKHVTNYLDDILIHTPTWEEHLVTLQELLRRLRAAGLTARPTKCQLGCTQVEFLGHIIQHGKIQPMMDKVDKIKNATRPSTKKQLRAFIGLASYYRRFVPHFASIASPLTDKTKNREPNQIQWTEREEKAFQTLKDCLVQSPVLCLPDIQQRFIVRTDASSTGLGAVLLQEYDGDKHPVAYASRKLLAREQAYSTIERECLALVWGINQFQMYLEGKEFTLETDHQPLLYLNRTKCINNRVMRWALALQPFRFRIEAIRGSDNVGADFLSRV